MGKSVLVFLCAALYGCSSGRVEKLERENRELAAKLETLSRTSSLDAQAKCAEQAEKNFANAGFDPGGIQDYTNHYNAKMNKCFVLMSSTRAEPPRQFKTLTDAFEGKSYGDYFWINKDGKQYYEVKPFVCKVVLPNGEDRVCGSQQEFETLIKAYMEQ